MSASFFLSPYSYSSLMKIQLSCGKTLQSRRRISPAVGGFGGGESAESTASKNSCLLDGPCGNLWSNFINAAADFISKKQRSVKGKSPPYLPGLDGCFFFPTATADRSSTSLTADRSSSERSASSGTSRLHRLAFKYQLRSCELSASRCLRWTGSARRVSVRSRRGLAEGRQQLPVQGHALYLLVKIH